MKKTSLLLLALLPLLFGGCKKANEQSQEPNATVPQKNQLCQKEAVNLPNYGTPGQRLLNFAKALANEIKTYK